MKYNMNNLNSYTEFKMIFCCILIVKQTEKCCLYENYMLIFFYEDLKRIYLYRDKSFI